MAVYRRIHLSFWSDTKITDEFTTEEKYFYLYLLTNIHTSLSGCYEISMRQMASESGLEIKEVKIMIKRLECNLGVIRYDDATKELLILNWHKYNWTKSVKCTIAVKNEALKIKNESFRSYILKMLGCDKELEDDLSNKSFVEEVVKYLNKKTGKNFNLNSGNSKLILERKKEGYGLNDFKTVIDKKTEEWKECEMENFLRPSTLFGDKFDEYLNEKTKKKRKNGFCNFEQRDYDFEELENNLIKK